MIRRVCILRTPGGFLIRGIHMKIIGRRIGAAIIGTALFFIFSRYASIPISNGIYISFQYAILGFFSAMYGPVVGMIIGLVGHALVDYSFGWGIWWSWVIASGTVGLIGGFLVKQENMDKGIFEKPDISRFIVGNFLVHAVAWGLIAPVLDILLYDELATVVFTQGATAAVSNFIVTAVIGTLLITSNARSHIAK